MPGPDSCLKAGDVHNLRGSQDPMLGETGWMHKAMVRCLGGPFITSAYLFPIVNKAYIGSCSLTRHGRSYIIELTVVARSSVYA